MINIPVTINKIDRIGWNTINKVNLNLNHFLSFFFLFLTVLSFFLIIKYKNDNRDLLVVQIPELKKNIKFFDRAINGEKSKIQNELSKLKNQSNTFDMYKAVPDRDIVIWLE